MSDEPQHALWCATRCSEYRDGADAGPSIAAGRWKVGTTTNPTRRIGHELPLAVGHPVSRPQRGERRMGDNNQECAICEARIVRAGAIYLTAEGMATSGRPVLHRHQPMSALDSDQAEVRLAYGQSLTRWGFDPTQREYADLIEQAWRDRWTPVWFDTYLGGLLAESWQSSSHERLTHE